MKKRIKVLEYNAVFTSEKEGGFSVFVPELLGCVSQGETLEEAVDNIKEAISLYLEDVKVSSSEASSENARKQFMLPVRIQVDT